MLQLGLEHARWRLVALRRDENQEGLRVGDNPAAYLPKYAAREAVGRNLVELVDQHASRLGAGHDLEVKGFDLELRFVRLVDDRFDVLLNAKPVLQVARLVRINHSGRLLKCEVCDFLRRPYQNEFSSRALIHDHRGEHDCRAAGRLAVLLRDHREEFRHSPNTLRRQ
jgi:hypothetical protein